MANYCTNCGKHLEPTGTFCGNCGTSVGQDVTATNNCESVSEYKSLATNDNQEIVFNQSKKSRLTASLLQLFVGLIGFLGLGRLYLGHVTLGIIQLLLSTTLFFTGQQAITFLIAIIDCIYVLCRSSLKDGKDDIIPFFSNHCERSRLVAALSQFLPGFFGFVGAGRLYLGHYKYGSVQLILSFIFLMTGLLPITYLIAFFDFIFVLCNKNMKDVKGRTVPLLFNSSKSEQNVQITYKEHETIINSTWPVAPVEIIPTVSSNAIGVGYKKEE